MPVYMYVLLGAALALFLLSILFPTPRRLWVFSLLLSKQIFLWIGDKTYIRQLIFKLTGRTWRPVTRPIMARRMAEDLGPTFIKFGQIVASSAGMFPKPYVLEFQKCLDRVRPFPFEDVERTLREDLGEKAARLRNIDPKPLASASIAQVHTAELDDGTKVVVKVQRPGIPKRVRADMRILRGVAGLAHRFVKDADLANPVGIVDDFAATLQEELDFRKEAHNCERFNEIMVALGHKDVRAPRPYHELTTPRVLVMERFYGTRVDDKPGIDRRGILDAEDHLIRGLKAWFQCVLLHGFFHGDVHAGNLMLLDNLDLGFLDFGIVGKFDGRQREMVTEYIVAFATGDYKGLAKIIIDMGGVHDQIDIAAFTKDLSDAYSPLLKLSFGDLNYAELMPQIHRVASKHRMKMPKEFVLITKQLLYFDRYAKLLAPKLNLFTDPRIIMSLQQDVMKARAMAMAKA